MAALENKKLTAPTTYQPRTVKIAEVTGRNHRTKIPEATKYRVLYKNADRCCVCRGRSRHLHHIDENPENNRDDNIAVVCHECHDKAHTRHQLSQNLTVRRIRDAKQRWEGEVAQSVTTEILPATLDSMAIWTFVNIEKLPALLRLYDLSYETTELQSLMKLGLVDHIGVPQPLIQPAKMKGELITLFDRIPFQYGPRLMELYSLAIHDLILRARPVDFRQVRTASQVLALAGPGTLCYALKGFRFSRGTQRNQKEIRRVYTQVGGVTVRFQVDTSYMFGTSALTDSFLGHRQAGVLLLVKSVGRSQGRPEIRCTPIAMGTGFLNRRTAWSPGSC